MINMLATVSCSIWSVSYFVFSSNIIK